MKVTKDLGYQLEKQCVANSNIGLAFASIVHPQHWISSDINTILLEGDKLYNSINCSHNYILINDI